MAKMASDSLPHKISLLSLQLTILLKIKFFFSHLLKEGMRKPSWICWEKLSLSTMVEREGEEHLVSLKIVGFGRAGIGQMALLSTTGTCNVTFCTWQLQKITLSRMKRGVVVLQDWKWKNQQIWEREIPWRNRNDNQSPKNGELLSHFWHSVFRGSRSLGLWLWEGTEGKEAL